MSTTKPIPLQVIFRKLDTSDAVEARVRDKVDKLGHFYPSINSCRVAIEQLHRHHQQGNHFHVRIDLKVPGHELVAGREPDENHAYSDVYVALRDAFDAMRRQLEDLVRHQQGHVKHHEERPHGHITEISPDKTFGRIESVDGRWLYFHRNSLIGEDLDKLLVGTPVYYVEGTGDQGPQASSVYPVGKHHILV
jgi:ribosome-associated translation inhibitor RaiA